MQTIVVWTYDPDLTPTDHVRDAHIQYLEGLVVDGALIAAGPRGDMPGGVLVFNGTDRDAVHRLLAADPFTLSNMITGTEIYPWTSKVGQYPLPTANAPQPSSSGEIS